MLSPVQVNEEAEQMVSQFNHSLFHMRLKLASVMDLCGVQHTHVPHRNLQIPAETQTGGKNTQQMENKLRMLKDKIIKSQLWMCIIIFRCPANQPQKVKMHSLHLFKKKIHYLLINNFRAWDKIKEYEDNYENDKEAQLQNEERGLLEAQIISSNINNGSPVRTDTITKYLLRPLHIKKALR